MDFVGHRFFIFTGCGTCRSRRCPRKESPFFFLASHLGFSVITRDPAMYKPTAGKRRLSVSFLGAR